MRIRPASPEVREAHEHKEYAVTDNIPRKHPELTEEQEISARFAAQMLGGEIASGPPPADSMLAWMLSHEGFTHDDVVAEYARRGVDFYGLLDGTVDIDDVQHLIEGTG
ncbi:MAG: hypothetical protein U0R68_15665 [Candidatus Nanopelagicales bacterium]